MTPAKPVQPPSLYRVYKSALERVPLALGSLNTNAAYFFIDPLDLSVSIWCGALSSPVDQAAADRLANLIVQQTLGVVGGQEPLCVKEGVQSRDLEAFEWKLGHNDESVSTHTSAKLVNHPLRLIRLDVRIEEGETLVELVRVAVAKLNTQGGLDPLPFENLIDDGGVYMLEVGSDEAEAFVCVGDDVEDWRRNAVVSFAKREQDRMERESKKSVEIVIFARSEAPIVFTARFDSWSAEVASAPSMMHRRSSVMAPHREFSAEVATMIQRQDTLTDGGWEGSRTLLGEVRDALAPGSGGRVQMWRVSGKSPHRLIEVPCKCMTSGDAYVIALEQSVLAATPLSGTSKRRRLPSQSRLIYTWAGEDAPLDIKAVASMRAQHLLDEDVAKGLSAREVICARQGAEPAPLLALLALCEENTAAFPSHTHAHGVANGYSPSSTAPNVVKTGGIVILRGTANSKVTSEPGARMLELCESPAFPGEGAVVAMEVDIPTVAGTSLLPNRSYILVENMSDRTRTFDKTYYWHGTDEPPAVAALGNLLCTEARRLFLPTRHRKRPLHVAARAEYPYHRGTVQHVHENKKVPDEFWKAVTYAAHEHMESMQDDERPPLERARTQQHLFMGEQHERSLSERLDSSGRFGIENIPRRPVRFFSVSTARRALGRIFMQEVGLGCTFLQSDLEKDRCYVIDSGIEDIFIWHGSEAPIPERSLAHRVGLAYADSFGKGVIATDVESGQEPPELIVCFRGWVCARQTLGSEELRAEWKEFVLEKKFEEQEEEGDDDMPPAGLEPLTPVKMQDTDPRELARIVEIEKDRAGAACVLSDPSDSEYESSDLSDENEGLALGVELVTGLNTDKARTSVVGKDRRKKRVSVVTENRRASAFFKSAYNITTADREEENSVKVGGRKSSDTRKSGGPILSASEILREIDSENEEESESRRGSLTMSPAILAALAMGGVKSPLPERRPPRESLAALASSGRVQQIRAQIGAGSSGNSPKGSGNSPKSFGNSPKTFGNSSKSGTFGGGFSNAFTTGRGPFPYRKPLVSPPPRKSAGGPLSPPLRKLASPGGAKAARRGGGSPAGDDQSDVDPFSAADAAAERELRGFGSSGSIRESHSPASIQLTVDRARKSQQSRMSVAGGGRLSTNAHLNRAMDKLQRIEGSADDVCTTPKGGVSGLEDMPLSPPLPTMQDENVHDVGASSAPQPSSGWSAWQPYSTYDYMCGVQIPAPPNGSSNLESSQLLSIHLRIKEALDGLHTQNDDESTKSGHVGTGLSEFLALARSPTATSMRGSIGGGMSLGLGAVIEDEQAAWQQLKEYDTTRRNQYHRGSGSLSSPKALLSPKGIR